MKRQKLSVRTLSIYKLFPWKFQSGKFGEGITTFIPGLSPPLNGSPYVDQPHCVHPTLSYEQEGDGTD